MLSDLMYKLWLDTPFHIVVESFFRILTFVFLVLNDSSFVTGQVIHNNGGEIMG